MVGVLLPFQVPIALSIVVDDAGVRVMLGNALSNWSVCDGHYGSSRYVIERAYVFLPQERFQKEERVHAEVTKEDADRCAKMNAKRFRDNGFLPRVGLFTAVRVCACIGQ